MAYIQCLGIRRVVIWCDLVHLARPRTAVGTVCRVYQRLAKIARLGNLEQLPIERIDR